MEGENAVDYLYDGQTIQTFSAPRIATRNTHGTGCTYSAAIAAYLARGCAIGEAVQRAKAYLTGAIQHSFPLGAGHGPQPFLAHGRVNPPNTGTERRVTARRSGILRHERRAFEARTPPWARLAQQTVAPPQQRGQVHRRVNAPPGIFTSAPDVKSRCRLIFRSVNTAMPIAHRQKLRMPRSDFGINSV